MPPAPKVLAVCVNWNGAEVLGELLDSLHQGDYPELEVLVVDNGSADGSPGLVTPPARLLQLEKNLGYAAAINRALESEVWEETFQYALILNNDVVLDPDLVGRLVTFAVEQGPCVCGPRIVRYDAPNRLEAAWGDLAWNHVLARFHGIGADSGDPRWNQTRKVELLLGSVLLIHREVLEKVGAWDEHFFLYHEEVDYLYRAGQSGFPVFYCPFVSARHHCGAGTRGRPLAKTYWLRRNTAYFLSKHQAPAAAWLRWGATLALSVALNLLMFRWKRTGAILRGVKDGTKGVASDG